MSKIRAMVIDDSAFMRKVIKNLLEENGRVEVIATARDGKHALEQLESIQPDVITLDVEMPIMNGLEFLSKLMEKKKIPVVMLSSLTHEGTKETLQALELGAVDFIAKPSGTISLDIDKLQDEIVDKVVNAARIDMNKIKTRNKKSFSMPTHNERPKVARPKVARPKVAKNIVHSTKYTDIVAIGTSTGGPRALQEVLTKIPADFPAPIVVVQHMPPGFTKSLAERLNAICQIEVVEATHQQQLNAGVAYIAPGNYHMTVKPSRDGHLQIELDQQTPPRGGHRPSVDVLYESIAELSSLKKYVVIMTGMGSDGTRGLQAIKQRNENGVVAIAEHESTCIVYGMPRSAIQMGLIDFVTKLDNIGNQLTELLVNRRT